MNRKTIIILGSCFVFATTLMIGLYAATRKLLHEPNSFLREYKQLIDAKSNEIDLGVNSYYIAGITKDHVYLGNVTAPFRMLITNLALTDTQHVELKVKGMDTLTFYNPLTVKIEPPYFYIADGTMPGVFRGRIGEWEADRLLSNKEYFTQLIPLSSSSFAIRTNQIKTQYHVLGKLQNHEPHITIEPTLLQKQVDGFFCTDGVMNYNKDLKKLVYTYYYRNEFIVYDTNLNLDYRGHTIDTFSRAQIKVEHIASENTNTLTYKKFINKGTCTSGDYLYINSNLLARNDPPDMFPTMTIVDVYDLREDTYEFSFSVPNYDVDDKIRDFRIFENKVFIALYDRYMVKYDLPSQYF
jgi:hypothetical protein